VIRRAISPRLTATLKGAYRELQQAQSEIVQAEKRRLWAGLLPESHMRINSPLGVLTSNVNLLEELARRNGESTDLLEDIAKSSAAASKRLRHIVKAFEAFTGLDEAQLKPMNLNEVIEAALTLLQHEIPSRVRVVRNLGSIGSVRCVPGRIHQAFMNLLTNA
jgi:signal transduction histidine kinase